MDLKHLTLFALAARHGSFAGAARQADLDPSAVSRAIATLEAHLNLRLFQRSTRRLSLTEAGALYLERVAPLLEDLEAAAEAAKTISGAPRGRLRVTTSLAFATVGLAPLLPTFVESCPDLSIEILTSDAPLDLIESRIDVALRHVRPVAPDLVVSRLMRVRYHVVASPGRPALAHPADLTREPCLRLDLPGHRETWHFRGPEAAVESVPVSGAITLSNPLALKAATLTGLGPALLADWLVREDLASGRLVDLFPDYEVSATDFETGLWAVTPSRRHVPAKTRAFLDLLRQHLSRSS